MKTPYYSGAFTAAQHTDAQEDDQLRERMLEHRLAIRDDARDIYIITALPRFRETGTGLAKKIDEKKDISWACHWALQVGDEFFELQRGYPDPLRTGLKMSKWNEEQQSQIIKRHRQGTTAMTDNEIKAAGERYFSRLERIDINIYDVWCNNCQVAIDHMLRDIGGLSYYRMKLQSIQEMVKQFFYNALVSVTQLFGRYRGWNEDVIFKYTEILHKTLRVMTSRAEYPKKHWIKEDIDAADGTLKKISSVSDHWFLTVLESSLSLKKGSEELYVRRGKDGKPELNFDALKKATKGMFEEGENMALSWLKAMPWLTAGFLVGTPRWAAAVISIALSRANELYEERMGLKGSKTGLEGSLAGLGLSPKVQSEISSASNTPRLSNGRTFTSGQRRVKSKSLYIDDKLVPRYERALSAAGVPYFADHVKKSQSWDAPDQQELCVKVTNPPLKRWEERQEDGRSIYVNRISGESTDVRPGPAEVWVIKKRVKAGWVKSTGMALPHGWEMRRTEEGEMYYLNHKVDPPANTMVHPMRQEIDEERKQILPDWNVEWDNDRGKKYRKMGTDEIRWKAIDGPLFELSAEKAKDNIKKPSEHFVEPLPSGWSLTERGDGQRIYKNGKLGKDRIERITHPLSDKRKRLLPQWETRYTPANRKYWIHYGNDGRGTSWWTRNRLLKNTSLKNNARGWKLTQNGQEWEWFEGGDVPHSEIPVLDLDDPLEIELREYPFILSPRLVEEDGAFIEPLPSNWVRRKQDNGTTSYWNFKDQVRSEQHPNEDERRDLPALWAMRFTRYGRQYFIDHDDGSTWWTHPREDKHEQKLRARPGQKQDGWKISEDGRTWGRFEEYPDAEATEEGLEALSRTQSTWSRLSRSSADSWRSKSNPRDWLKSVDSNELITNARTVGMEAVTIAKSRIPKTPKLFKKSTKSPSMLSSTSSASDVVDSPQAIVDETDPIADHWTGETPEMLTEEPQSTEDLEQVDAPPMIIEEPELIESSKPEILSQDENYQPIAAPSSSEVTPEGNLQNENAGQDEQSANLELMPEGPQPTEDTSTSITPKRGGRKDWAKRTRSNFLALKKKHGKKNGKAIESEVDDTDVAVVEGLGITSDEPLELGGEAEVLPPIEEKGDIEQTSSKQ